MLFADESEALTHPYLAGAWARCGAGLMVEAPGQGHKVAMIGTLDLVSLIVHPSRRKRSSDVIALLERLDRMYGPKPSEAWLPAVIVLDNRPVHTSKATMAAFAERPTALPMGALEHGFALLSYTITGDTTAHGEQLRATA